MNTVEILKSVRTRLSDPAKWYKGSYYDSVYRGKCCVLGAMRVAVDPQDMYSKARLLELTAVAERHIRKFTRCHVACWNDDPMTTHEDLMAVLDKAIESALAEEEANR